MFKHVLVLSHACSFCLHLKSFSSCLNISTHVYFAYTLFLCVGSLIFFCSAFFCSLKILLFMFVLSHIYYSMPFSYVTVVSNLRFYSQIELLIIMSYVYA